MTNNTFKYYKDKNGELKIEMTQNVARDVASNKAGFEACAMITLNEVSVRKIRTAEHIAGAFLEDSSCYEATKSEDFVSDDCMIPGYEVFLNAVEAKIGELLGWASAVT